MSAVTGNNTRSVVRAVRGILHQLPRESESRSEAMNLQKPLNAMQNASIDDYSISARKDVTPHLFVVKGEAVELFTAMTNWQYYEAFRRYALKQSVVTVTVTVTVRLSKTGNIDGVLVKFRV